MLHLNFMESPHGEIRRNVVLTSKQWPLPTNWTILNLIGSMYVCHINGVPGVPIYHQQKPPGFVRINLPYHTDPFAGYLHCPATVSSTRPMLGGLGEPAGVLATGQNDRSEMDKKWWKNGEHLEVPHVDIYIYIYPLKITATGGTWWNGQSQAAESWMRSPWRPCKSSLLQPEMRLQVLTCVNHTWMCSITIHVYIYIYTLTTFMYFVTVQHSL